MVTTDNDTAECIRTQLRAIIRPLWSNPPNHGARIVATILNNPALNSEWYVNDPSDKILILFLDWNRGMQVS